MPLFLYPKNIEATAQDGKLYALLLSFISTPGQSNGLICSIIAFGVLYGQGLMINHLVNEQRMTNWQTFLPAMSFLLITSLLPEWNYLSPALVSSAITVWAFIKVFKLYNTGMVAGAIFNIGLLLGISSFIYFPSIAFILCILLGLMILRPVRFNEFVILLLGVITPYYFYLVYLFLNDKLVLANVLPQFNVQIPLLKNNLWAAIAIVFLGVPFLMGGYFVQTHLGKMLIQARKNWSILLLYLVISLIIPFINSTASFDNWVIVAAPFAAFHACAYLYPRKPAVSLAIFFLTVAFILFQQYGMAVWKN